MCISSYCVFCHPEQSVCLSNCSSSRFGFIAATIWWSIQWPSIRDWNTAVWICIHLRYVISIFVSQLWILCMSYYVYRLLVSLMLLLNCMNYEVTKLGCQCSGVHVSFCEAEMPLLISPLNLSLKTGPMLLSSWKCVVAYGWYRTALFIHSAINNLLRVVA